MSQMESATLHRRYELTRKNTFQRMLDLEQKNKVNRMQASQYAIPQLLHKVTAPERNSLSSTSNREFRPALLHETGRAMTTTPTLSISIPSSSLNTSNEGGESKKYVVSQTGDLIPQEEDHSEDDSEMSSICHSPGWDNISGKKKKQEKKAKEERRREKEKSDKEAKATRKTMAKLSKAPPVNGSKRLSRKSIAIDRSSTEPVLPTLQDVAPPTQEPSQPRPSISTRPRRGSLEAGLRSFISTKTGISSPWKTLQTTPIQTKTEFVPSRNTSKTIKAGFIGGLKLRQSEEVATHDMIQRLKTGAGIEAKGLLSTETLLKSNISSSPSLLESSRPMSIYEESARTPQQWDGIFSQAAAMAMGPRPTDHIDDTPIMERNIKKNKKHPPTSRYFLRENEEASSSKREPSLISNRTRTSSNSGIPLSDNQNGQGHRLSSMETTLTASSSDHSRGRSDSYVGHQREQSQEQSLAGFRDETQVSENKSQKRTSSRMSIFRRSRELSRDAPSTIRPRTRDNSLETHIKNTIITSPFLSDEYVVPQLHLGDFTTSPRDDNPKHTQIESMSGPRQNLHSPEIVARNHSAKPSLKKQFDGKPSSGPPSPSPTGSFASAVETQSTVQLKGSKRALATDIINGNSTKLEARQLSGDVPPPTLVHDFALTERSPADASPDTTRVHKESPVIPHKSALITSVGKSSTSSHSRSTTDSSEEYSTLDEFSNITSPAISRPHSEREYSRSVDELGRTPNTLRRKRSSKESGMRHNGLNGHPVTTDHPVMTGAIPVDDDASRTDSWCRTAIPMDSSDGEDRMKTPTERKDPTGSTHQDSASLRPPPKTSDGLSSSSNVQRKPSLARSISTPDLQQDLSFLPALKHQALTKPIKKSRGFLGRKNKQASVSCDNEKASASDTRPPPSSPLPMATTKSEGSSPTSPQPSSQYLQNARLNISGSRSPKFPHSGSPHLNNGPESEPVAKMFVVCCSCKYFHDMPSKIYECMAKPDNVVTDAKLGVSGVISTSVKCPWCGHGMSTSCCAGYAAVVYLREKFH